MFDWAYYKECGKASGIRQLIMKKEQNYLQLYS